jgi:hypothetical protein
MLDEIAPIKIFLVSEPNPLLNDMQEKFKKAVFYMLTDFYSALAHAHLEADFVFVFGMPELKGITFSDFVEKLREISPSSNYLRCRKSWISGRCTIHENWNRRLHCCQQL